MRRIVTSAMISSLIGIGLSSAVLAQGMPTFDATAVAKMIKQIEQSAQQLKQMEAQLNQMKDLHNSLNGLTEGASIQDLFGKRSVANALPDNYADYQKMIKAGGGKTGEYARIYREENEVKLSGNLSDNQDDVKNIKQQMEEFYQNAIEKQKDLNAESAGTGQSVYESAVETAKKIEDISKILEKAQTPKQVQDFQAQLVALQAKIQTDMLKMQSLSMAQLAYYRTLEAREDELHHQKLKKLKEYYASKIRRK